MRFPLPTLPARLFGAPFFLLSIWFFAAGRGSSAAALYITLSCLLLIGYYLMEKEELEGLEIVQEYTA